MIHSFKQCNYMLDEVSKCANRLKQKQSKLKGLKK